MVVITVVAAAQLQTVMQMTYESVTQFWFYKYFLWSPYVIYFHAVSFFLFFIPRLISAVGDWMSAILPHMVWP